MTTIPDPLPPINETPQVIAAGEIRDEYLQQVAIVRNRPGDEIAKATTVVALWRETNAALDAGLQDVLAWRAARVAYIESQVPWGPDLPATASDADRAVLLQAWRTLLAEARAATDDELHRTLTDAVAVGDDLALRAGLSALVERDGGREKARSWWLQMTGETELLDEAVRLSEETVLWRMRIKQLFAPVEAPPEVDVLEAAQVAAQAALAAAQAARPPRRAGFFG
jgi:hypothetical protein